jgi:hypothetical protein
VGRYFIEHIDGFARRVLQVAHELQHVQQQGNGMGGLRNQDKREFLAFSWEGLEPEKTGSGRLSDATRRDVIDAALVKLGYFNCLAADDQRAFANKQTELSRRREATRKNSQLAAAPASKMPGLPRKVTLLGNCLRAMQR